MIIKKKNLNIQETKQDDINLINEANITDNQEAESINSVSEAQQEEDLINEFCDIDFSSLEFKERVERRRGDRRRGYRRIDERSLVSRAQEEAKSIRDVAKQEGYNEGLERAKDELSLIKEGMSEFFSGKKEMYEEISSDILEIALEVAKKIIKKEVSLSDEVLKNVLSEVLEHTKADEQKLTFKVSSEDYEKCTLILPEMLKNSKIEAKLSIVPSDEIEQGSCILSAGNGVIDANFKTQLQIIEMAFGIYKKGNTKS